MPKLKAVVNKMTIQKPAALFSNGKETFMPHSPEMMVGTVKMMVKDVRIFIVTFKLLLMMEEKVLFN